MVELGFIDDEKYARRLIQNYWNTKRFGIRRIKFELSKRHRQVFDRGSHI